MSLVTVSDNLGNIVNYLAVAVRGFFEFGGSTYRKINDSTALRIDEGGTYEVVEFPATNDVALLLAVDVVSKYPAAADLAVGTAYRTDSIDYLIVAPNVTMRIDSGEFINYRPDNGDVGVIADPVFTKHP